jgi:hypothetical protein
MGSIASSVKQLWIDHTTADAIHDRARNGWIEVEKLIRVPIREPQKLSLDQHESRPHIIGNRGRGMWNVNYRIGAETGYAALAD